MFVKPIPMSILINDFLYFTLKKCKTQLLINDKNCFINKTTLLKTGSLLLTSPEFTHPLQDHGNVGLIDIINKVNSQNTFLTQSELMNAASFLSLTDYK